MRMVKLSNYIGRAAITAVLVLAFIGGLAIRAEAADVKWAPGFPKLSEGKVLLMWDTVDGADSYKVYRRRGKEGERFLLTTSKANRHIDEKPEAGHTYYYSVAAMKGEKELGKSEEKPVKIKAEKAFVPMAVPKLMGAHYTNEADNKPSVGVRWEMESRPSDLAAYNVYRSEKKGGPYTLIGSAQSMDFKDRDVVRGKTYYYAISAVDTNFKETNRSNEESVEIPTMEVVTPTGKKPTPMVSTKHLFDIKTYKDERGKEQPAEFPVDVAVDEAVGHIYVVSNGYGGVLVYNLDGKFQFGFRADGRKSTKKIKSAHGVCVGPDGKIYVVAYQESNIYVFDIDGKLDNIIEVDLKDIKLNPADEGKKPILYDVVVNSQGDIIVDDPAINRIHVYDYRGRHKYDIDGADKRPGSDQRLFNGPGYETLDKEDNFYVTDTSTGDVLKFDKDGNYVKMFVKGAGRMGEAEKPFVPVGICIDDKGRFFVANGLDPNVQAFDLDGNFLFALSNEKMDGPIKVNSMRGIYVDSKGRLYVTEVLISNVSVYQIGEKTAEIVVPVRDEK